LFLEDYGPKYDKAVACLAKDRDVLPAFYDYPAKHWKHIRTTNPLKAPSPRCASGPPRPRAASAA